MGINRENIILIQIHNHIFEVNMNSKERHELRYQRRKLKRKIKENSKQEQCSFDNMLSPNKWIQATNKCKKNVFYKPSVQAYMSHPLINMYEHIKKIESGQNPFKINTSRIIIRERGKERKIEPISFNKRIGEHVFCDHIYLPYFQNKMIYDNGASIKNRGTDFARRRILRHIEKAVREYGHNFYAWQFDFKSFFDSVAYATCKRILTANFQDSRIVNFSFDSISEYTKGNIEINISVDPKLAEKIRDELKAGNGKGICLGSQNSQITALIVPNELDHLIKDVFAMLYYCRYMDDGVVLSNSKEKLKQLWAACERMCQYLKLNFNTKKTKIVKMSKGFVFLKTKYQVLPNGKILRRPHRSGIVRNRRKLKRFSHLVSLHKMSLDDVYNSFQSYYNHTKKIGKSFKTRKEMLKQYRRLFGDYKLDQLLGGKKNAILQSA